MLNQVLTIESLELAAKQVTDFLDNQPSEDINELALHGNELVVWISRTGKMVADAGWWRDQALVKATDECTLGLPPSVMTKYIAAKCQGENYLYTWIERLNRSCVHRLDWCRTLISKAKEEMRLTGSAV